MVRALNVYIEEVRPWDIAKKVNEDVEAKEHLEEVLAYTAGSLVQIADLLQPFLPTTAASIQEIFTKGVIKLPEAGVLFPKIYNHTPSPDTQKTKP